VPKKDMVCARWYLRSCAQQIEISFLFFLYIFAVCARVQQGSSEKGSALTEHVHPLEF